MSLLTLRGTLYDDSPWVRSSEVLEAGKHYLTLDVWQHEPESWREVLRMPINGIHDEDLLNDLEALVGETALRLPAIRERIACDEDDIWDEYEEQMASYHDAVGLESWR